MLIKRVPKEKKKEKMFIEINKTEEEMTFVTQYCVYSKKMWNKDGQTLVKSEIYVVSFQLFFCVSV